MLLEEIGYKLRPLPVCSDNQGAIFISSNPIMEQRSKHIDIHYHYIHDVIEKGAIEVFFVPGVENPVDIFTKNLGPNKIKMFRKDLGLHFAE